VEIQELLKKINQLAKISKERELTESERLEQQELRKIYLECFRSHFKSHLESIKIVDENGNVVEKN